jgi:hypothetical protein
MTCIGNLRAMPDRVLGPYEKPLWLGFFVSTFGGHAIGDTTLAFNPHGY